MAVQGYDEVVLLTGLPTLLARKVATEILSAEPKTLVRALVKASLAGEAAAFADGLPAGQRERLELIDGDVAAIDFGLSGAEYVALASEIDRIHHCAQVSYLGVERREAEHVNVGGAREVLEFADMAKGLKRLVHYSSASVAGNRTGVVHEDELEHGQRFGDVVQETKARAEKLVRAAMDRVPAVVLRPAAIVGDSRTGEIERFDGPYFVFLLIVTSPPEFAVPLPRGCELPLQVVPVDYVARVGRVLARDVRATGRTFHVVDPAPLAAKRVFELVAAAGGRPSPRGTIPANFAKAILRTPGLERFVKSPRVFLDALLTPVTFASPSLPAILSGTGIACPSFDSYVEPLVGYMQTRLRERRARKVDVEIHDPLVS